MTVSLINTITLLNLLDSLIPITSSAVIRTTNATAGKLRILPVLSHPWPITWLKGAEQSSCGIVMLKSFIKLTK